MSFVGYKYARERRLDLSLSSSDGFEPVEEEEEDARSISPYSGLYPGYAASVVSESPSASLFQ
jgi:hypothetical protein